MISIVIPVYNEEESLPILFAEIEQLAKQAGLDLELIFVDDGSKDGSWKVIQGLAAQHPHVQGIRFRRNFGKAAALSAGFATVRGDIVMTLDADLQDDPAEIPCFLARIDEGLDVISGWKKVRYDPWHKVWPSRVFNGMVSWLTEVPLHDHNCGMKCYRVQVLREIRLYGELHRFIPVLAAARGFKVGELVINHRARRYGSSKYGVRRFVKGFLDLLTVKFLTGFGDRPQHVLGTLGLGSFLLGSLARVYMALTWVWRLWHPDDFPPLHDRPLLIYGLAAFLLGAQLISMGLIAELIADQRSHARDSYSISERTHSHPADSPP